eukprot:gene6835-12428_t
MRRCLQFISPLTVVVTSLTLVALSVERYIACVHGLRFHQIVTNRRVSLAFVIIWVFGFLCAACNLTMIRHSDIVGQSVQSETPALRVIVVVIEIPTTCFTLIVIQATLFKFSRKKLLEVQPGMPVSSQAEQRNLLERQLKIAFVAAIVVITYLFCSFPGAILALLTLITHGTQPVDKYNFAVALWMLNAFTDPFVYGFGMRDTRKALIKQTKSIISALLCCVDSS